SHWVHATGAGYETRELVPTLSEPDSSYIQRSMYWMQLQPYLELFEREQIEIITQEELQSERGETMRKAFRFAGVDEGFSSEQFDREWEKSSAKQGDKYQLMEKLIKLPGFRSFDRNFDRLPERMRWIVEKVVHDPDKPPAPKPKLPDDLFETVRGRYSADVAGLQKFAGREFAGWHDYS
ncbi:MAG TPA: sulfotransferase domain-containing protein, partial [Solirubrobacterales bacterium]